MKIYSGDPVQKEFEFKGKINILTIADTHCCNEKIIEEIKKMPANSYDVIFTLGDIPVEMLKYIKKYSTKAVYGVLGNHDEDYFLKEAGIQDLSRTIIKINGLSFTGIGGSFKYKPSCIGYTQEESIKELENKEKADILISHDTLHGLFAKDCRYDMAHQGLQEINEYMKNEKVKIDIHGHYHQNLITDINGKKIISCYGLNLIKINNNKVEKEVIF